MNGTLPICSPQRPVKEKCLKAPPEELVYRPKKNMKSLDKPLVKGLSLGSVPGVGNFLDIENIVKQCRHPVIYIIQLYVYSVLYQYAKICIYIYTCLYIIYIYV